MPKKTSEDSVPVQELKTSVALPIRRFLKSVLIVLLVFICIVVGALVHHLQAPVQGMNTVPRMTKSAETPTVPPAGTRSRLLKRVRQETPVSADPAPIPELPPPEPAMILPEPKATLLPDITEVESENPIEEGPSPVSTPIFSLSEAMLLRDHLAMGEPCLSDLQQVMHSRLPVPINQTELIECLMPICTANSAFKELQTLFLQNKKDALTTYYRLNNPRWLAYLKALGSAIVDVRRIHPLKQRPKDLIFQAQEALAQKQIGQVMASIQKLPPAIQADFREFSGLAASYVAAQRAVERLILSFGEGEE